MRDEPLNLTNIKYFCDTVRLGSVSAAAKKNFVTQSAISQGISKLERSLGIPLTTRHPNRFKLTPEGQRVFDEALDLLHRAMDFKQTIAVDASKQIGCLEFACTYSFAVAMLPAYLKKFTTAFPDVDVRLSFGKNTEIKQMIRVGAIDFGLLPDEEDLVGFDQRVICQGDIAIYAASKIKKAEIGKLGFILGRENAYEVLFLKKAYQKLFGKELFGVMEVDSWEVTASLVAEGLGMGFFPDYVAFKAGRFQKCHLGLEPLPYRICAVSLPRMQMRKSSEIFLSYFSAKIHNLPS